MTRQVLWAMACLSVVGPLRAAEWSLTPWQGRAVDRLDNAADWATEGDQGAQVKLVPQPGPAGGLQLQYALGDGQWVQIRRDLAPPLDLSGGDCFGFVFRGAPPANNNLEFKVTDADGDTAFLFLRQVGHVDHPVRVTVPYDALQKFTYEGDGRLDLAHVRRIWFAVSRLRDAQGQGIGPSQGSLTISDLQFGRVMPEAGAWPREAVRPRPKVAAKCAAYILSQQTPSGLVVAWEEEPDAHGWLYSEALALFVLTETKPDAAAKLAARLVALQNADGSWYDGYWLREGLPRITDTKWCGSVAWTVMALARHAALHADGKADQAARRGAGWLESQLDAKGKPAQSVEGTLDTWWALQSVPGSEAAARRVQTYLLSPDVWDEQRGRFRVGHEDNQVALDVQTWGACFADAVGQGDRAARALTFTGRSLFIVDQASGVAGLDGWGPFAPWNEGTGQWVVAWGREAERLRDELIKQQRADGAVPGGVVDFSGDSVWHTRWHGVSPTAWLYFGCASSPFRLREALGRP